MASLPNLPAGSRVWGASLEGSRIRMLDPDGLLGELRAPTGLLWAHVELQKSEDAVEWLTAGLGLHPVDADDALNGMGHCRLGEYGDALFLTAPLCRLDGEKVFFQEIAFYVRDRLLVSLSTEPVPLIDRWFVRWSQRPESVGTTAPLLLFNLLDEVVDGYFPIVDALQDQLDALETAVFEGAPVEVKDGLRIKWRFLQIRRHLSPFRDVVNGLLRRDVDVIPNNLSPYFQTIYDHTLRIIELCDLNRELLASILDAHVALTSNRLNRAMRLLTVISTVLMSMALISGIYGMNFVHMPELAQTWGYPFALALMLGVATLEVWIFKRLDWI